MNEIEVGQVWKHLKRGTTYKVVGVARGKHLGKCIEDQKLVVYQEDGEIWVRRAEKSSNQETSCEIGVARGQGKHVEDQNLVVYQGDGGGLWVRSVAEFLDSRFEFQSQ